MFVSSVPDDIWLRTTIFSLQWRHNGHGSVSKHQPHDCLLNRLFRRRSKKTLKLRVTGLCAGNSPGTGKFPAQMGSNTENVSIWWRHHAWSLCTVTCASWLLKSRPTRLFFNDLLILILILYITGPSRHEWKFTCDRLIPPQGAM